MCMVSLYLLAILCCHTIDWDIFLRYWCLSQIYYIIIIARDIKLLHSIKHEISNSIVSKCLSCALSDSSTVIGYKLAYRENFNIDILEHDLKYCLEHVKPEALSIERQSLIKCVQELPLTKCRQLIVNGFISEELDDMINFLSSK